MGQPDSQFKAFIRFILDDIKELQTEADEAKKAAKIEKIIDNLQKNIGGLTSSEKRARPGCLGGLFNAAGIDSNTIDT